MTTRIHINPNWDNPVLTTYSGLTKITIGRYDSAMVIIKICPISQRCEILRNSYNPEVLLPVWFDPEPKHLTALLLGVLPSTFISTLP